MKTNKIFFILTIIFLLLGFNICYAVDLNMVDDSDLIENSRNINTNSDYDNSDDDEEEYNTNSTNTNNTSTNNTSNTDSTISPATVTDMNSASNSELQLSDILNIFLIVIGILLILLSIAILIRLKQ